MKRSKIILLFVLVLSLPKPGFTQKESTRICFDLKVSAGPVVAFSYFNNDDNYEHFTTRFTSAQKDTLIHRQIVTKYPLVITNSGKNFTQYVLFPGDSILFSIKDGITSIKDYRGLRNEAELNFFTALNTEKLSLDPFFNQYTKSVFEKSNSYTKELDAAMLLAYAKQKEFLVHYRQQHGISSLFESLVSGIFLYNCINNRLMPFYNTRYAGKPVPGGYVESMIALKPQFDHPSLLQNEFYRAALYNYNKFLCGPKPIALVGDSYVAELYSKALSSFKKENADYIIYDLMRRAATGHKEWFIQNAPAFDRDCGNPLFQSIIREINGEVQLEAKLDPAKMNLLDAEGKVVRLQEMLGKSADSVVYVDFWAGWCVPCLMEMPKSLKMQAAYKNEKIKFIYLSMDKDKSDWLKSMKTQSQMSGANSYLVIDNFTSSLAKSLSITSIPRYVVYNKNKTIAAANAPHPGEEALKILLNKLLKN